MDDNGTCTVGRIRTDCIMMGRHYMQSGDARNYMHLRLTSQRYYDTLDDNTDAKKDLKDKWDSLSYGHKKVMSKWDVQYNNANPLDKHDLFDQKQALLFSYEIERFIEAEHNYMYFKTYWDM